MNFATKWHICSENAIFVYVYIIFRQILNIVGRKLAEKKEEDKWQSTSVTRF